MWMLCRVFYAREVCQRFSMAPAFYAVALGRKPGVYKSWAQCQAQVKGFRKAKFKKFGEERMALEFIKEYSTPSENADTTATTTSIPKRKNDQSDFLINEHVEKRPKLDPSTGSYTIDSSGTVTIYTDGACSSNGYSGAAAGIGVYWGPDHPLNLSLRLPGRQTNNRAEIHAAIYALKQAKEVGAKNVILYTDSQFLINGITNWINKWKKNGWKLGTGKPVINREDFEELDEVREGLNIKWVHIDAHSGIPGNEAADHLAVSAIKMSL